MPKPSRMHFLKQVERLIAERFPSVKLERSQKEFALVLNGHWTSLENLYRMAVAESDDVAAPDRLTSIVDHWVTQLLQAAANLTDQLAPFYELRTRIMPIVVSRVPTLASGAAMLGQQLVDGLHVCYVLDDEQSISYVSPGLFDSWHISLDELHEVAIQNLVHLSATLPAHAAQDEDRRVSVILIQLLDGYDAARILLPGLYDHLRGHLGGPFAAGIPNRDILICFRDEPETVDRIRRQIVADHRSMPHQVTDRLFLITADGIAPYAQGV